MAVEGGSSENAENLLASLVEGVEVIDRDLQEQLKRYVAAL